MVRLTEGEIDKAMAALGPYVQEWGLPLNPEDVQAMAVAVLVHGRSEATLDEIEAHEREWIRANRAASENELASMRKAAAFRHGNLPQDGLTEDELTLIEGRAARATPGPWKAFIEGRDHSSGADFVRAGGLDDACPDLYLFHENIAAPVEDHDFVAHARQDVPRLVAEVRRLRSLLETEGA